MKNLFVITSAIHTKFGKFDGAQRLEQTIETLKSIRTKDLNAYIIISEASIDKSITAEESQQLVEYADVIINLSNNKELQDIYHSTTNHDIVKNYSEMLACIKIYNYIATTNLASSYDRVFKLSGRYLLNDNFKFETYEPIADKIVFASRRQSQFDPHITGSLSEQFMCRLYSFPMSDIRLFKTKFSVMLQTFVSNLQQNKYTDLEHSMFRDFLTLPNILELPIIGVEGQLGPNAIRVED